MHLFQTQVKCIVQGIISFILGLFLSSPDYVYWENFYNKISHNQTKGIP